MEFHDNNLFNYMVNKNMGGIVTLKIKLFSYFVLFILVLNIFLTYMDHKYSSRF
jgi:hypothetical protein